MLTMSAASPSSGTNLGEWNRDLDVEETREVKEEGWRQILPS